MISFSFVEHFTQDPMNAEKTIAEVEWLEGIYSLPDTRPLKLADRHAANQRHDETYADNPWFRYGSGTAFLGRWLYVRCI
jgi:hypothetical protein